MAASTITRATITDGVGGTTFNSAWVNSAIFDEVDNLLNANLNIGGVFTAEGAGTNTFSAGTAGSQVILVRNTTAGTAALAALHIGNDADADLGRAEGYSSSYTETGSAKQDGIALRGMGDGGLSLAAEHASGDVRVYARGTAKTLTFNGDQTLSEGGIGGSHAYLGVLRDSIDSTQQGTPASTAKTTLHTFSLPAGALASDGQAIRITAAFGLASNNNGKLVGIDFGATTIFGAQGTFAGGSSVSVTGGVLVTAYVIRTGAATQKAIASCSSKPTNDGNYAKGASTSEFSAPTETLSGAVTINIWGQNSTASANDITAEFTMVEYLV